MIEGAVPRTEPLASRAFWGLSLFYAALSTVLVLCAAAFVVSSWHWPLVGDAPLMHYVVFLMEHGLAPYRQIVDLNQPGTFAVEAAVMALFGKGALAWRVFDLLLLGATGVAMAAICRDDRPWAWFPALFAAVTFALIHGRDGLIQLGQRDLLMATLLAAAYALLFQVVRSVNRERYGLSLAAGLCLGAAASVKPDAVVLAPVLLGLIAFELRHRRWKLHLGAACAGVLLPLLASFVFLLREHALAAYVELMVHLAPYHASTWRLSPRELLVGAVSSVMLPLFCLWVPVFVMERRWRWFEDRLLLAGFLFGVFSFYLQGRGYPYHRYPSEVFLLLLAGIAFTDALRPRTVPVVQTSRSRSSRLILQGCAGAGLVFGALVVVPRSLVQVIHFDWHHDAFQQALRADLTSLGGSGLNGQVQCLEMAGGCITTLYGMQLVESSGFLYDCYLYPTEDQAVAHTAERERYRRAFMSAFLAHPPRALVVSSDECGPPDFQYRKLARWPWLDAYLGDHYRLVREHRPTELESWGGRPALPNGYRIYWLEAQR